MTRSSRTPIIVLSVLGGILFAAVFTILVVFASRIGGEAPLATLGPTEQTAAPLPSAEPDGDGEPGARFTSFTAQSEVQCPPDGEVPPIEFAWETTGALQVWFTPGDDDAVDAAQFQLPLSGTQADLIAQVHFPCGAQQRQDYTITLLAENGEHVSDYFTVTDLNWTEGGSVEED